MMNNALRRSASALLKSQTCQKHMIVSAAAVTASLPTALIRNYQTSLNLYDKYEANTELNYTIRRESLKRAKNSKTNRYTRRFDRPKFTGQIYRFCSETDEYYEFSSMFGEPAIGDARTLRKSIIERSNLHHKTINNFSDMKEVLVMRADEIVKLEEDLKETLIDLNVGEIEVKEEEGTGRYSGLNSEEVQGKLDRISAEYLKLSKEALSIRQIDLAETAAMFSYYANPAKWDSLCIAIICSILEHSYYRSRRVFQVLEKNQAFIDLDDQNVKTSVKNLKTLVTEFVQFIKLKNARDFTFLYAKLQKIIHHTHDNIEEIREFNSSLKFLINKVLQVNPPMAAVLYSHPNVNSVYVSMFTMYYAKIFSTLLDYGMISLYIDDPKMARMQKMNLPSMYSYHIINDWVKHIKDEESMKLKLAEFNGILRALWKYSVKTERLNFVIFTNPTYRSFLLQAAQYNDIEHMNNIVNQMTKKSEKFNSDLLASIIQIGGELSTRINEDEKKKLHPIFTLEGVVDYLEQAPSVSIMTLRNLIQYYENEDLTSENFVRIFALFEKEMINEGGMMTILRNLTNERCITFVKNMAEADWGKIFLNREKGYNYIVNRLTNQDKRDDIVDFLLQRGAKLEDTY